MLLGRCEFGKEDYSLNIVNLPVNVEPTPAPSQEGNLNKNPSKEWDLKNGHSQEGNMKKNSSQEGNKMGISREGNAHTPNPLSRGEYESPLLGGDAGVGKSGKGKKSKKDTNSKSHNKQKKLFE